MPCETLDILVNKAGIYENYPLEDITEERFHKQFDLNVLGLLLTSQQGVKHFGSTGGNIINISALASTVTINRELIRDLPWQISLWERIPERVVHVKGSDTNGTFTVTKTEYARSFQKITDGLDFHNI